MNLENKADIIVDYLFDGRYKQAVLVNGAWGTGKTFFVEEVLSKKLEAKECTVIHYSLYGVNSCDQIRDDIKTEMLISICSKKTKFSSKVLSYIPNVAEVFANIFNRDLQKIEKIIKEIDFDTSKFVVIFDDLERSTAEINNVLGLINSYVENQKIKVVIVANENEIGSSRISSDLPSKFCVAANSDIVLPGEDNNDNNSQNKTNMTYDMLLSRTKAIFSNDIIYNAIKEKLVGLSITLKVDFYQLYPVVVEKYANESTRKFLIENKEQAIEILQIKDCQNLRTLIFGIITFDKIYLELIDLEKKDEEYNQLLKEELLQILRYVIYRSIQYKSGEDDSIINKQNATTQDISRIMARVKEYEFVNNLILYHDFNSTDARNFINNYILDTIQETEKDENRKKLSYYKLGSWEWLFLNDEDVIYYSDLLYEELKLEKYDTRYFKDIIIFLLQLNAHFFEKKKQLKHEDADYISLMEKYICDHDINPNLLDALSIVSDDSDFTEKYNKCVEPLIKAHRSKTECLQQDTLQDMFSNDDWDEEFYKYCRNNRDSFLDSHSFLSSLSIERILEKIKGANNNQIREFTLAICSVYDFGNIRDFFQSDVTDLKKVVDLFQNMIEDANCECTRRYVLKIFKAKLDEKLDALK